MLRPRPWLSVLILLCATQLASAADDRMGWLGVRLVSGDPAAEGARIARVVVASPADRGGLRGGDIIVSIDGETVANVRELVELIRRLEPGSWVSLGIERDGADRQLDVKLDERPERSKSMRLREGWLGLEAIELPAALREHFGAPADAGVMISAVSEAGPGEAAGFRLGDVVFEVSDEPIASIGALREAIAGGGVGNTREFRLARDGAEIVLEATIGSAPAPPAGP